MLVVTTGAAPGITTSVPIPNKFCFCAISVLTPAEERLNQLQAALPKMQAEADQLRMTDVNGPAVLAEAETLYDRWPTLPTADQRKIAEALVEKIVIGEGEIDIMFSYLPTSEELCKNQQQLRGPG